MMVDVGIECSRLLLVRERAELGDDVGQLDQGGTSALGTLLGW